MILLSERFPGGSLSFYFSSYAPAVFEYLCPSFFTSASCAVLRHFETFGDPVQKMKGLLPGAYDAPSWLLSDRIPDSRSTRYTSSGPRTASRPPSGSHGPDRFCCTSRSRCIPFSSPSVPRKEPASGKRRLPFPQPLPIRRQYSGPACSV